MVGGFTVGGDVQTFTFLLFADMCTRRKRRRAGFCPHDMDISLVATALRACHIYAFPITGDENTKEIMPALLAGYFEECHYSWV